MIRSAVTVSLVPEVRGGPFVFWDDLDAPCRKAAALGFDGIEIFPRSAEDIQPAKVQPILDRYHIKLAAAGTGAGGVVHKLRLSAPDKSDRSKAKDFVRAIIDAAGAMGAPAIVGSIQGRWGDGTDKEATMQYLGDSLQELAEHALQYRVPLLYEFLNRYETNLMNDVAGSVRFFGTLTTKNIRILADLYHMNIEEADLARAIRAGGHHIGHVHFADSNRRPAGCGHTDFAPIAEALRQIGYDGYMSAEAFAYPDPDAAAKLTIEAFGRYFREASEI